MFGFKGLEKVIRDKQKMIAKHRKQITEQIDEQNKLYIKIMREHNNKD